MRVLELMGDARVGQLPNVPTIAELENAAFVVRAGRAAWVAGGDHRPGPWRSCQSDQLPHFRRKAQRPEHGGLGGHSEALLATIRDFIATNGKIV